MPLCGSTPHLFLFRNLPAGLRTLNQLLLLVKAQCLQIQSPGAQPQSCPIDFSLTCFQYPEPLPHGPILILSIPCPSSTPHIKKSDLLSLQFKKTCNVLSPLDSLPPSRTLFCPHIPCTYKKISLFLKTHFPVISSQSLSHYPTNISDLSQHLYLSSIIALYYSYYILWFYVTVNYIILLTLLNQPWTLCSNLNNILLVHHQGSVNT